MIYQEGVSGYDYITRAHSLYVLKRMAVDTNVAARPFLEAGVEVYACDVYERGRDVIKTDLLPEIKQVKTNDLEEVAKSGLDGVILIGCHAMNGAEKHFCHIQKMWWHGLNIA